MKWSVLQINPMTGAVLRALPGIISGTWQEGPLNGVPEISITSSKSNFPRQHANGTTLPGGLGELWERGILPWADGLAVIAGDRPLVAGPLTKPPVEALTTVALQASGIEALLEQRLVLSENYTTGDGLRKGSPVALKADSLSYLAWKLVEQSMTRLGRLPIVGGVAREDGTSRERNYDSWNVANNGLWKRLQELAEVLSGPDMAFRPEWVPGEEWQRIQWRMVSGTKLSPYIVQPSIPSIDLTAPDNGVTSADPRMAWDPCTRLYGYGAGEGAGTLISMSDAAPGLATTLPPMEAVMADGGVDNWGLLQDHVDAGVAQRNRHTAQLTVSLPVEHPSAAVSGYWCGDAVSLTTGGEWWQVAQGTRLWRCIKRGGNIGERVYTIDLQED